MNPEKVVLDHDDVRRALVRIAHEIVERNGEPQQLALVGIHRRGVHLAARLHAQLTGLIGAAPPLGAIDISFYRDDVTQRPDAPVVNASDLDFPIDGLTVVIVDDVLFTRRTVRPAIEALFDYGRPPPLHLPLLADPAHP